MHWEISSAIWQPLCSGLNQCWYCEDVLKMFLFKSQFNSFIWVHLIWSLHIMNWCRTDKMSQDETIRTQFSDTYVKRHNHGSVHWYPIPHNLTHCLSFFHLPLAKQLNWYADQATPSPRSQLWCPNRRLAISTTMLTWLWLYCYMYHNAWNNCHVRIIKQIIIETGQTTRFLSQWWLSYRDNTLSNGISYTGEMSYLYWIGVQHVKG